MNWKLLFFLAMPALAQELEIPTYGYTQVLRDSQGNYFVLNDVNVAGLPVSKDAAQPAYGGGTCNTFFTRPPATEPCRDLYLRKIAPDGKSLLAATYLGGSNAEVGGSIALTPEGDVILAFPSYSENFAGAHRPNFGNTMVLLRLNSNLSRIEAQRRPDLRISSVGQILVTNGRIFFGSAELIPPSQSRVFLEELNPQTLQTQKAFMIGSGIGAVLFKFLLRPDNILVAAWGGWQPGTSLTAVDASTGTVRWQTPLDEIYNLKGLELLPSGGFALLGIAQEAGKIVGFVQRINSEGRPVEPKRFYGSYISFSRVVGEGRIQWIGAAPEVGGLPTTSQAPQRCRPLNSTDYFAELNFAEGSPSFVSYFPLGQSLRRVGGELAGFPMLREGTRFKAAELPQPVPGPGRGCLESEVESYAVTLGRTQNLYTTEFSRRIAPGEFLTLFGADLSSGTITLKPEETGSIPQELGGTRVLVDGQPAGIVALSPNRLTIAAPFAIAGKQSVQVAVERNGELWNPVQLAVTNSKPYILSERSAGAEYAGAYHKGQLSLPERPVFPGDEVAVFLVGLGTLQTPLDETAVVKDDPLPAPTSEVRAFVEGAGFQQVLFAGAVKGQLPGLTQVNVRIAPDLTYSGRLTLSILLDGNRASTSFWLKQR